MTTLYRLCPNCSSRRPLSEAYCEGVQGEGHCQWDLLSVEISEEIPGQTGTAPIPSPVAQPLCANGHVLGEGDIICLECGASATEVGSQSPEIQPDPNAKVIQGWHLEYRRNQQTPKAPYEEYFAVNSGEQNAIVRLYDINHSPDPNVMTALKRLPSEIVPNPIYFGDHEDNRGYYGTNHSVRTPYTIWQSQPSQAIDRADLARSRGIQRTWPTSSRLKSKKYLIQKS